MMRAEWPGMGACGLPSIVQIAFLRTWNFISANQEAVEIVATNMEKSLERPRIM
jgi:hypothetical protein